MDYVFSARSYVGVDLSGESSGSFLMEQTVNLSHPSAQIVVAQPVGIDFVSKDPVLPIGIAFIDSDSQLVYKTFESR